MKAIRPALPILLLATVAGCVASPPAPPAPAVTPAPYPSRLPPAPADWRDAEYTRGDWRYAATAGGSLASFAQPGSGSTLSLRCDRATSTIILTRAGVVPSSEPIRVLTTSSSRVLEAAAATDGVSVTLNSRDPLFDSIVFSRGRFAVEAPGLPTLTLPTRPEIARVVEDCR